LPCFFPSSSFLKLIQEKSEEKIKIRKLLILTDPADELEKNLQKMYIKRVQEMMKKAISLESIFSIFDEIFHGIAKTEVESQDLYSFY
jgi:translation initiation factor IF-2